MTIKPKSLTRIEQKMEEVSEDSYRYQVLSACKKFKTTWIELGQSLYGVHRDKLYQDWGFLTFEAYCRQELGIKNATALKLLKSYRFLEKEEPDYIEKSRNQVEPDEKIADVDAVNLLRLAKNNKSITGGEYKQIRDSVLEKAQSPESVRKSIRMMSERDPQEDPEVARAKRRLQFLKKLIKNLETTKLEAIAGRLLPPKAIDMLDHLGEVIERELSQAQ